MYICNVYESSLKFYCQRFSNNNHPIFTDQELLTVYLFYGAYQQYFKIKDIHTFTKEYLLSWFPNLLPQQTFNYRLNLMSEAISELVRLLIHLFKPQDCDSIESLVDLIPIKHSIQGYKSSTLGGFLVVVSDKRKHIVKYAKQAIGR